MLAWLAFQLLRPSSDARRSRRHIRALRMAFLDQLRRRPRLSESRFESQIYHRISQLSSSREEQARVWLLRWGVVLLNCSHISGSPFRQRWRKCARPACRIYNA